MYYYYYYYYLLLALYNNNNNNNNKSELWAVPIQPSIVFIILPSFLSDLSRTLRLGVTRAGIQAGRDGCVRMWVCEECVRCVSVWGVCEMCECVRSVSVWGVWVCEECVRSVWRVWVCEECVRSVWGVCEECVSVWGVCEEVSECNGWRSHHCPRSAPLTASSVAIAAANAETLERAKQPYNCFDAWRYGSIPACKTQIDGEPGKEMIQQTDRERGR